MPVLAACGHAGSQRRPGNCTVFGRGKLMRITGSVVAACALMAVACNRGESTADAHQQANTLQTERPAGEPRRDNAAHPTMHITGCVEPGVIAGTFMLTQVDLAGTDAGAGSTIPGGSRGTSGQADDRAMAGERADAHTAAAATYTLRSLERGTDLRKFVRSARRGHRPTHGRSGPDRPRHARHERPRIESGCRSGQDAQRSPGWHGCGGRHGCRREHPAIGCRFDSDGRGHVHACRPRALISGWGLEPEM